MCVLSVFLTLKIGGDPGSTIVHAPGIIETFIEGFCVKGVRVNSCLFCVHI